MVWGPKRMDWWRLLIAGLLEVAWAIGLQNPDGFRRPGPTALTVVGRAASMFCLALAVRTIPIGTGYAVWTGIGAVGTVVLGMVLSGEPRAAPRLLFIAVILIGIVGRR